MDLPEMTAMFNRDNLRSLFLRTSEGLKKVFPADFVEEFGEVVDDDCYPLPVGKSHFDVLRKPRWATIPVPAKSNDLPQTSASQKSQIELRDTA